jgi:sigma-E factor negative regulatory protein RseA
MKTVEFENVSLQEQLSALHDGELSASQAAALVSASLADSTVMQQWRSMSMIGSILREQQNSAVARPAVVQSEGAVGLPAQEAANDGVFRWKMVAGLAAFAAVGSLAWGLLGNLGEKADGQNSVMAQNQSAPATSASAASASGQGLIAVGGQVAGQEVTMIRDPRLDELLAAHKQFGGSSALQQPAGSLRSVSLGSGRP